jgi:cytochrome P450
MSDNTNPIAAATTNQTIPGQLESNPVELALMAKNRFGFWEAKRAQYGPIFHFNLFNRDMLILNGPDAWRVYSDPTLVTRVNAALPALKHLFVEENIGLLDGIEHDARKSQVMAAFSHQAFAAYLPVIEQTIAASFQRWSQLGEFAWLDELKYLGFAMLCRNILGIEPGEQLSNLQKGYAAMVGGLVDPANFPTAMQGIEGIFTILDALIQERQQQPQADGLSRILAAATAAGSSSNPDGYKLSATQVRFELHHLFFAGSGLYAFLVNLILQLHDHPEVLAKLKQEVSTIAPGNDPLSLTQLVSMTYLNQVVMEVKRLSPVVTLVAARALQAFEFGGYTVPANAALGLPVYSSNLDATIYTNANEFDPDRFNVSRAEQNKHPYAFAPQGAGAHGCAGYDYTNYVTQIFAVALVRLGYSWELPAQNLNLDWTKQVPEPTDGLKVRIQSLSH